MYTLSILTPEKKIFINPVYSTIVPGLVGYFEVLAHHAPLIALTRSGRLEIFIKEDRKETYAISNGFIEVSHNKAHLFVDTIELISAL